jgi:hypothetical protein
MAYSKNMVNVSVDTANSKQKRTAHFFVTLQKITLTILYSMSRVIILVRLELHSFAFVSVSNSYAKYTNSTI